MNCVPLDLFMSPTFVPGKIIENMFTRISQRGLISNSRLNNI